MFIPASIPKTIKISPSEEIIINRLNHLPDSLKTKAEIVYLDEDKLKFPLLIRNWVHGDCFFPYGMKGRKKVSDFFIDAKFSIIDKENTRILCSGEEVVWIIGYAADRRFAITKQTRNIIKIETVNKLSGG